MHAQTSAAVSINPASGETLETYPWSRAAEIDAVLDGAAAAARNWRRTSLSERSAALRGTAAQLRGNLESQARLITAEIGKPIRESRAEVEKCAWLCEWCAENAPRYLQDEVMASDGRQSFAAFEPLGTILAIMPWNFPYWQAFRCAIPALVAGNALVLKHASNVTGCALAIEKIFAQSGLPDNLFRTLVIDGDQAQALIGDSRIAAVSLTGSTAAGRAVAAAAGRHIKKSVLELGGSDAFVVLADADISAAAATATKSRFQNAGQSCIAAKRFILVSEIAEAFVEAMVAETRKLKVGDPLDESTDVGPLARADLRDGLQRQLVQSVKEGAEVVCGGTYLQDAGFFYAPTVVTSCMPGMPLLEEETFGPVAAITVVPDAAAAVVMANHSQYGLGGNIWTADIDRGIDLARQIDSGNVFINGMTHSDPRLPFGGVKASGYGRELSGFGLREFTNIKTVWVGATEPQQRAAE